MPSEFRPAVRRIGLMLALLAAGTLLSYWGFTLANFGATKAEITLRSLSPDDSRRVTLRELKVFLDRNFVLELEDLKANSHSTIFRSPDEGFPAGSERIIWSTNSDRFLLLGRKFMVFEDAVMTNGEQLYLLYEIGTGTLRCNAVQQRTYARFTTNDLKEVAWLGYRPYP